MKETNKEIAIKLALELGFAEDGSVSSSEVFRVGSVASGYRLMKIPARLRLKLPNTNWKITIGARTTCIYEVANGQVDKSTNFNTKDVDKIKEHIENNLLR